MGADRLQKLIFVRRFLRLRRKIVFHSQRSRVLWLDPKTVGRCCENHQS